MAIPVTTTYKLMNSIQFNLRKFASSAVALEIKTTKTFKTGFVFSETLRPAITVFPLGVRFLGRRDGGIQILEYEFSIDIYSAPEVKLEDAKAWCLRVVDDVKECLRGSIHLVDEGGAQNSFATEILEQSVTEGLGTTDRGFRSVASVRVVCRAFHTMNSNRVLVDARQATDFDSFLEAVSGYLQAEATLQNEVGAWVTKVAVPVVKYPAVYILPENEVLNDVFSGRADMLERPVVFSVVSVGQPQGEAVWDNIVLVDKVVAAIEKYYRVGGYADDCQIDSIGYDYAVDGNAFQFISSIRVRYKCVKQFSRVDQ